MFTNINKVVRLIVITDFFYNAAFASFAPVFAIFITGQIRGGSAQVAGFATAAYWLTKSVLQLPIAQLLDKTDGEHDEFWALFCGYLLSAFAPIGFIYATQPWHIYAIQASLGFVMAWAVPAWYSIFTRHVDQRRIGFEWSLESVFAVGIATSIAAALGGYIADHFGFRILYLSASIVSILATLSLLGLKNKIYSTPPQKESMLPPFDRAL